MKDSTKKVAFGAMLAAAAGYLAGLLTAPKSGKETRSDIKNTAVKAKTEAEKQLKALHSELSILIDKAKVKAGPAKTKAEKDLTEVIAVALQAKEKARQVLSAFHEGGAEDKELQSAIHDVNNAVTHLKKFLTEDSK
jgi:gas vesicle protein